MFLLQRKPTSPGEILKEEFLKPLSITQRKLADHLHCDYKVVNRIVNEKASVTLDMASRLAQAFETTPDFWLNAQMALDLWQEQKLKKVRKIPSLIDQKKRTRKVTRSIRKTNPNARKGNAPKR